MNSEQLIAKADQQYNSFIKILPSKVSRDDVSQTSKSALKAHLIRAGLLHRIADISNAVLLLYKQDLYLPSIILARSLVETFALLHYFCRKLEVSVKSGKVIEFEETLMQIFIGDRESDDSMDAINILTAIDKLNKELDGVRPMYDSLCEVAHPNWNGVVGFYGKELDSPHSLSFEPPHRTFTVEIALRIISEILECALEMDVSLKVILDRFTSLHERAEEGNK